LIPAGFYPGIQLSNRMNVTVQNVKIHDYISGITFQSATNITATNNTITGISEIAIFSGSTGNCTISKNDIANNYFGTGILVFNTTHIHISEDNIKRKSVGTLP
jgi:nitrous oxidase accessory protein NosD